MRMTQKDKRLLTTILVLLAGVVLGFAAWWLPIAFSMVTKAAAAVGLLFSFQ